MGFVRDRQAHAFALPLRTAAVMTGLLHVEAFVCGDMYGNDYQSIRMYDASVIDDARRLHVNSAIGADGVLSVDVARLFFVLNIRIIANKCASCQQATFPLLAEVLRLKIRCFHPGEESTLWS